MKTTELLQQVKFLVDAEGNQTAVQLGTELWQKLQPFLKAMQADEEIRREVKNKDEIIPWDDFLVELAAIGYPTEYNSPEDFIAAIKSDFAQGGLHTARRLAYRGVELYPDNEILQKYAHILAPPKVTVVPSDPERRKAIIADDEWIDKNRLKYLNRWVALRAGELVADAASSKELRDRIGDAKDLYITGIF